MHMLQLLGEGLGKVLIVGLVLGAGLPALFALGVRLTAVGAGGTATLADTRPNPAAAVVGWLCFALVAVAIALGIAIIVSSGFGYKVSFEHVFPTFVAKH